MVKAQVKIPFPDCHDRIAHGVHGFQDKFSLDSGGFQTLFRQGFACDKVTGIKDEDFGPFGFFLFNKCGATGKTPHLNGLSTAGVETTPHL